MNGHIVPQSMQSRLLEFALPRESVFLSQSRRALLSFRRQRAESEAASVNRSSPAAGQLPRLCATELNSRFAVLTGSRSVSRKAGRIVLGPAGRQRFYMNRHPQHKNLLQRSFDKGPGYTSDVQSALSSTTANPRARLRRLEYLNGSHRVIAEFAPPTCDIPSELSVCGLGQTRLPPVPEKAETSVQTGESDEARIKIPAEANSPSSGRHSGFRDDSSVLSVVSHTDNV
ncbi:MAG: hypothetical protein P4M11_03160 [Candidatus Pacebacteria bacterium]|nr:hypothetical protein [Candidatus Paceibacterota bacterium]